MRRASVLSNITVMVVLFAPGMTPVIRSMFSVPSLVLQNAMACKVFRLLKFGLIHEDPTVAISTRLASNIQFKIPTEDACSSQDTTGTHHGDIGLTRLPSCRSTKDEGKHLGTPMQITVQQEPEVDVNDERADRQEWKRSDIV